MTELSPSARKVLEDATFDDYLRNDSGGLKGGVAVQVRKSLVAAGLIERVPYGGRGDEFDDGEGATYGLRVTEAGKSAVAGQKAATGAKDGAAATPTAKKPRTPRENSKTAQLIAKLREPEGATVEECSTAFGWKPHTTRAAISTLGKKDASLKPTSDKVEGRGRVYRLPTAA